MSNFDAYALLVGDDVAEAFRTGLKRATANGLDPQRAIGKALGVLVEFAQVEGGDEALREMIELISEQLPERVG